MGGGGSSEDVLCIISDKAIICLLVLETCDRADRGTDHPSWPFQVLGCWMKEHRYFSF